MKKMRKYILMGASVLLCCSSLIGCNQNGSSKEDTSTLIIHGSNMGYGIEWVKGLAKDFTEETGIAITLRTYDAEQGIGTLMNEIEKGSDTDIIFTKITNYFKHAYEGKFLDITDIMKEKDPQSGNTSMEERMNQSYLDFYNLKTNGQDKYYGVGWVNGVYGIVRNKNMWKTLGLTDDDMPYTTDELLKLCQKVVDAKMVAAGYPVTPFINCYSAEYYTTLLPVWFMQYEGKENMELFNQAIDPAYSLRPISVNPDCASFYEKDGMKAALNVLQSLLLDHPEYQHALTDGYPSFKTLQNDFLKGRNALFMPNGSWLESETSVTDYDVDFIPTPIVSSIIDKVDVDGQKIFKSINNDAKLSEVIKYIRNGKKGTAPQGIVPEDIEEVENTINYASYLHNGLDHQMVIMNNSDKAKEAKQFIKYMYSDKGLNKYYKYTGGGTLGAMPSSGKYDPQDIVISDFRANFNSIIFEGHLGAYELCNKNKVFCYGGVSAYMNNGLVAKGISAVDNVYYAMVDSKKTGEQIYNTNQTYLRENWPSIFAKIPK